MNASCPSKAKVLASPPHARHAVWDQPSCRSGCRIRPCGADVPCCVKATSKEDMQHLALHDGAARERPALRHHMSPSAAQVYANARSRFETFLTAHQRICEAARAIYDEPSQFRMHPGGPVGGVGHVTTELTRRAAAAWQHNFSYQLWGPWVLLGAASDVDCPTLKGWECLFPGSVQCQHQPWTSDKAQHPGLQLRNLGESTAEISRSSDRFWSSMSHTLAVDAIFLYGLAVEQAFMGTHLASDAVRRVLSTELATAMAGHPSEGIVVGLHFRNRGDVRLDGRIRVPLSRYIAWVDELARATKVRAVYVASDHAGNDAATLAARFPGRRYAFRTLPRRLAGLKGSNLFNEQQVEVSGPFRGQPTQLTVQAISDINILSHCDAFLGAISNFLPIVMSRIHARDPLLPRGRVCGLMNAGATFGPHADVTLLERAGSKFASELADGSEGDAEAEKVPIVCLGSTELRNYGMVLYGHNIPLDSPDVLPIR